MAGDDEPNRTGNVPSGFEGFALGIAGLGKRASWQHGAELGPGLAGNAGTPGPDRSLPGLQDEERLPWLHSAEDERDEGGVDTGRVWAAVLIGLALLAAIAGGAWWSMHRGTNGAPLADGGLIAAPPGPIKVAPRDPGGKMFDGTGDSSFTVSQGHAPGATLADAGADGGETGEVAAPPFAAANPDGTGVQVGAFSTQLAAETAWDRLAKAYEALSGASHRIVEGKADIGTVYQLEAVVGSDDAATALCARLKAAGLNCRVKD